MRPSWPMPSATGSSPVQRSTSSRRSRRRSLRCSRSSRSSSRRTSALRPGRHRTRPATRLPTWCNWRSPASSCRSPSTSMLPRQTRRCGRSCRSPSASAGCSPHWSVVPRSRSKCAPRVTSPGTTRASSPSPRRRASSARSPTSRSPTSMRRSSPRITGSRSARPIARRRPTSSTCSPCAEAIVRCRARWSAAAANSASS